VGCACLCWKLLHTWCRLLTINLSSEYPQVSIMSYTMASTIVYCVTTNGNTWQHTATYFCAPPPPAEVAPPVALLAPLMKAATRCALSSEALTMKTTERVSTSRLSAPGGLYRGSSKGRDSRWCSLCVYAGIKATRKVAVQNLQYLHWLYAALQRLPSDTAAAAAVRYQRQCLCS
jgi:hypothetical protein